MLKLKWLEKCSHTYIIWMGFSSVSLLKRKMEIASYRIKFNRLKRKKQKKKFKIKKRKE